MDVELLSFSEQFMHCKITPSNSLLPSYLLTTVYASNSSADRLSLWEDLENIAATTSSLKWMVGGDFNEVRYVHEKRGGRNPHIRRISNFNNSLEACHLLDLRSIGPSFTWSNNQDRRIACKLDRVMVNHQWLLEHTDSFYHTLPPGLSDHSALQVSVTPSLPSGPHPFKYIQAWEHHPQFEQVVQNAWRTYIIGSPMYVLVKKLQHLKARAARNSIRTVKIPNGSFSNDLEVVKSHAKDFFFSLLNKECSEPIPTLQSTNCLGEEDIHTLSAPLSDIEIKKALFSAKPLSSPGLDDFPARFFQQHWAIVKEDFILAIRYVFTTGYLLQQVNHSYISLIPKSKNADCFENFRPISLCNSVYKTLTKILADRLQKITGPRQSLVDVVIKTKIKESALLKKKIDWRRKNYVISVSTD
ncbi:hypothetical protein QJS10_CPA06g01305 [Acorus calamus]|uniref:Reverse transcriptase n=1 Tax=Acorus calamus TaxID=4465 RepID=A0AAV9EMQ2_ACOCL|nr:hypothetical protein QJS10_CPA06g01305 [Acorus calamus]